MANGRSPKRERQKQRRDEKRRAQAEEAARRRRNRTLTLGVITAILVLGLAAIVFLATRTEEPAAGPGASPDAATGAEPDATSDPGSDTESGAVACGAEAPETADEEKPMFDAPQEQALDPETTTIWRLETSCGAIEIELAVDRAPETTNSIAFLTRQGFFDGLTFHRVVPDFVIQGGDPEGTGSGGPGYQITEPPPDDVSYDPGTVAMAKANPDPAGASGSQFFIVSGEGAASLPPDFALVGEVVNGMDAVGEIEALGTGDGPPSETAYIEQATIVEEDG